MILPSTAGQIAAADSRRSGTGRDTFAAYVALKEHLGEPGRISHPKFAAKLAKNRKT